MEKLMVNDIRELTMNEAQSVVGGSLAFAIASSWSSAVLGAGVGLTLGGPVGGLIGGGAGFSVAVIVNIGYFLSSRRR